jgi:mono/diheme cytochrome c family protein
VKRGDIHYFSWQAAGNRDSHRLRSFARIMVTVPLFLIALAAPAAAQEAEQFFKNNCAACHTIGSGRLTGPDLKGVTTRRERAWLREFIPAPVKKVESGDPYMLALQKQYYGIVMPSLPGLTPALVDALLDYIDEQSAGGQRAAAAPNEQAVAPPEPPSAPAEIEAGRAIFAGGRRLSAAAPACISCHTMHDIGGLGGGKLAPDLTLVGQRLGHRQGLTAWLSAPATPTMASVFGKRPLAPSEIASLAAYLDNGVHTFADPDDRGPGTFAALGLGFAFVGLIVMNIAWRKRFRSVRRVLVDRARKASLARSN